MFRRLLLAASAAALCAGPAAAQVWTQAPTANDMAAAFPEKAKTAGVGGVVEMICTVAVSGALKDCQALGEEPKGYGFGAAARKLAAGMKAAGVPDGEDVRFQITFPAEWAKGGPLQVRAPKWAALPSVADMSATFPKTEGGPNDVRVTLVCDVQAGGTLSGCTVDREAPAGQGFGQAVLALAPKFKVEALSADGTPTVGAKVRVPVRYDLKPVSQASR